MRIVEYFGAEHRKVALLLDTMLKAPQDHRKARDAFAELRPLLTKHIYCEEELLFPEVEARGLSGPTEVMRFEHGQIWSLLSRIGQEFEKDNSTPTGLVDELRGVLEAHDLKEENILYPAADEAIQSADALVEKVRKAVPMTAPSTPEPRTLG